MGESREGEGRAGGPTSDYLVASLIQAYKQEGRDPAWIHVRRESEGFYSLIVQIHGESEPDEVYYLTSEEIDDIGHSTPFGGYKAPGEGG